MSNIGFAKNSRWFWRVVFACASSTTSMPLSAQTDPHIDASDVVHRYDLTFARHELTNALSANIINSAIARANTIVQTCDRRSADDQDVAAAIRFNIVGGLATFSDNGLNVIDSPEELAQVLAIRTAHVKIVDQINFCEGVYSVQGYAGCAISNGNSMVVAFGRNSNPDALAQTLVHELGHNRGLGHRGQIGDPSTARNIMARSEGLILRDELNQAEVKAYHGGGVEDGPNRKVDHAFLVDTTASMTRAIEGARTSMINYVRDLDPDACNAFQLVTFKDSVELIPPTTDPDQIIHELGRLSALGGDDCPEAVMESVEAVMDDVKDGGIIHIATDASPYSAATLGSVISRLAGRSISANVVLAHDCRQANAVDNNGQAQKGEPTDVPSAIAVFSELAERTNGVFAFIPEVNTSSDGRIRYAATHYNILRGSDSPTIALASPGAVPTGAKAAVRLRGLKTNFQAHSQVLVSGDGVTIERIVPISSVELLVVLNVAPSASVGFRKITTVTGAETAIGTDALQIIAATGLPTITSIFTNTARPGDTVNVTVLGIGTNFNHSSILNLGAGISVSSVRAISPQALEATVTVAPSATVGFRDVSVATGSEIANESLTGPFFVAPIATGGVPLLTAVSPASGAPGASLSLVLTGSNTAFAEGISAVSFSGVGISIKSVTVQSPTQLTAVIAIDSDAPLGFRDVRVTTDKEVAVSLSGFLIGAGVPAGATTPIPTLSSLQLTLVALALAIVAVCAVRRRGLS